MSHDPFILGNDPIFNWSWRLQVVSPTVEPSFGSLKPQTCVAVGVHKAPRQKLCTLGKGPEGLEPSARLNGSGLTFVLLCFIGSTCFNRSSPKCNHVQQNPFSNVGVAWCPQPLRIKQDQLGVKRPKLTTSTKAIYLRKAVAGPLGC